MKVQQVTILEFSDAEDRPLALWDSNKPNTLRLRTYELTLEDLGLIQSHMTEKGNAIKSIDYSLCTLEYKEQTNESNTGV